MIDHVFAAPNLPFAIAIVFLVALVAIELVGSLTGLSLHGHADHPDFDHGLDAGDGPLDWLGLGKVPLLILIAEFCAAFATFGLLLQAVVHGIAGTPLAPWLAAVVVLPPAVLATRWLSIGVARVLPREETVAVTQESLVGRVAEITGGTARPDNPAEARVRDAHGHVHYVRVRPADDGTSHGPGTRVVLLARDGTVYTAAAMPEVDKI